MTLTYSTYEAKAKFSEIIRRVRSGQRIVISHRGRAVAEIRPLAPRELGLASRVAGLEEDGVIARHNPPAGPLRPLVRKPGALSRFLEARE